MHKIGVVSDTHGFLREDVLRQLSDCEAILHAGDLDEEDVLEKLGQIAPVYAVRGNADQKWGEALPLTLKIEICGISVQIAHKKKDLPADLDDVDLVVLGHTHRYADRKEGGKRILNPGSCGKGRLGSCVTMAVLEIEEDRSFQIRRVDLLKKAPKEEIPAGLGEILPAIMRDIDKGRSITKLAEKYQISSELAENICRMYLTHQKIDVEGILRRLGL